MFGNIFGDFEKKQQEILAHAETITVDAETEGIRVTANGKKEIVNISITNPSVLADKEQLEDLLVVTINRALEEAGEKAAIFTQSKMEEMLPPGMAGLFKQ
jgi:nucleoid-associated protein EbfC